jgi:general secretion pathway protein G
MRTPLRQHGVIGLARAGARRAFTLIEILIVVVILGILASIVLASVHKATEDSAQTVTRSELAKVRRHLEAYRSVNSNQYPVVAEGEGT